MPIEIEGRKFYRIGEACFEAGANRSTVLRWIRENKFEDVSYRDLNGWRLFSEKDVNRLKTRTHKLQEVEARSK
jgi:hypothetical protein